MLTKPPSNKACNVGDNDIIGLLDAATFRDDCHHKDTVKSAIATVTSTATERENINAAET